MTDSPDTKATAAAGTPKVQIHYIKSNQFRVISADGVIGSPSPPGKIFFAIFSERLPIPRLMTHLISDAGQIGQMVDQETRGGIVREMEVGVSLDRDAAIRLRDWLTANIATLDDLLAKKKT